jgi:hypothetical protein
LLDIDVLLLYASFTQFLNLGVEFLASIAFTNAGVSNQCHLASPE